MTRPSATASVSSSHENDSIPFQFKSVQVDRCLFSTVTTIICVPMPIPLTEDEEIPPDTQTSDENDDSGFTRSFSSFDSESSTDDFKIQFFNQKIGNNLETEVFTQKVVVASIENNSEAAGSTCLH